MAEGFGHAFRNPELLRQALRHRSAGVPHNERLEFLGDALVNLVVAEALHDRWPKADEGALTRARASLVRESALAALARGLQIGDRMQFGPGEMKSGGHRRESILADAFEALVAAIYLDAGFDACRGRVLAWFGPLLDDLVIAKVGKDAKTRLQEWLQARQLQRPEYQLIDSQGEDHARTFHVRCLVQEPALQAEGEGSSLRAAEQAAAEQVLLHIEVRP